MTSSGKMGTPGAGDRWMAGERLEGVAFAQRDVVVVVAGPHAGARGVVILLLSLPPDPLYLVELEGEGQDIRVRQSALRAEHSG